MIKYRHKYTFERGWSETGKTYLINSTRERKEKTVRPTPEEIDLSKGLPSKAVLAKKNPKAFGRENGYLDVFQKMIDDPDDPKTIKMKVDPLLESTKEPNLAKVVSTTWPKKKFTMACKKLEVIFLFQEPLTKQEQTQLKTMVEASKSSEKTRIDLNL